jgi:hypothetical protein
MSIERWIDVRDHLPEQRQTVFVRCKRGVLVRVATFHKAGPALRQSGDWETDKGGLYWDDVTHWQPLPGPSGH